MNDTASTRRRKTHAAMASDHAAGQHLFHFGVLTVSDTSAQSGPSTDTSGPLLRRQLEAHPSDAFRCLVHDIVPDEKEQIRGTVQRWIRELNVDLVITTGGTGFAPRDVTPEVRSDSFHRRCW